MRCKVPPLRLLAGFLSATALLAGSLDALSQADPSPAQPALRLLLLSQTGEDASGGVNLTLELLAVTPLRKVIPPSDELPVVPPPIGIAGEGLGGLGPSEAGLVPSGFWFELVTGDGRVLYRRIMENPIMLRFEGIDPEDQSEDRRLTRVESLPASRVVSLLIPDLLPNETERFLVLVGSPLGRPTAPASELGRVRILPEPVVIASIQED